VLGAERDMLRTKMAENRGYMQDWERQGKVNHAKNQVNPQPSTLNPQPSTMPRTRLLRP